MKKTLKKVIAVASAVGMLGCSLALTACGGKKNGEGNVGPVKPPSTEYGYDIGWSETEDPYEYASASIYSNTLGEFYQYYNAAKKESTNTARFALMAQAEAKLYESGVLLPTQANGGNYAVSRVAPYTGTSTLWGQDSDRLHYVVPLTTPVVAADRAAIREYKNDEKNATQSGADYLKWLKKYLSDKGYEVKNTYNRAYTADPETWDVFATSQQNDSEPIVQTFDCLVEYDVKNQMQPALSTNIPDGVKTGETAVNSFGEEEDTYTFTFKIRKGQQWVDNQGRKVADLKASDFVTGFQHMMDAQGGLEFLAQDKVVGANEYIAGETTSMDDVGVVADDKAMTVTYTVYASAESYFTTMLCYSVFAPLSKTYYESLGGKFGEAYAEGGAGEYGTAADKIAFCGPYRITEATAESTIKFEKNDSWWNSKTANARTADTITWLYNDGKDATKVYTDFKAGTIDGCGLTGSNIISAKEEKVTGDSHVAADTSIFDAYSYTSAMDATAFCFFFNLNRASYTNASDKNAMVSPMSEADRARTNTAMQNVHFRRALVTGVDRKTYNTHIYGTDLAENAISNMYVPGTFVTLPGSVTLTMGDKEVEYAAGTYYGQIVQDQLNADGFPITVWKEKDGEFTYTGFDGWFNADYAKAELNKAVEELAAEGVTVDANNPIYIDYPYMNTYDPYVNRANAVKQMLEEEFEGKIKINLVGGGQRDYLYATYYYGSGADANYTINDNTGWGPDYGDPSTYLDTMLPDYAGYMAKSLGIF